MSREVIPGYECEFTQELPSFVRSMCPICLLVLREPFQVTCCGKSFCRACIEEAYDNSDYCPACKQDDYDVFPDKGLQQDLYSFHVHCSNKDEGCDWRGELRALDEHVNPTPSKNKQLVGCPFTKVKCVHCKGTFRRCDVERHQSSECHQRPFVCELCEEYGSTYERVVNEHAQICSCRPVDCPNGCGSVVQHHRLVDHLSKTCELSQVECEFSHAGCDVRVIRKDLPGHLADNMAKHMSLLASENQELKSRLGDQTDALVSFLETKDELDAERGQMKVLIKQQSAIIEAFRKQMRKQHRPNSSRNLPFIKKVKRRRGSL